MKLFTFGRYDVVIVDDIGETDKATPGYGVLNRDTGIVEYSSTLYFQACKFAKVCELESQKYEDGVDDVIAWPPKGPTNAS